MRVDTQWMIIPKEGKWSMVNAWAPTCAAVACSAAKALERLVDEWADVHLQVGGGQRKHLPRRNKGDNAGALPAHGATLQASQ